MRLTEETIREALPRRWSPGKSQPEENHWFRFKNAIFVRGTVYESTPTTLRQVGAPTPCLIDLLEQNPRGSEDFIVKLRHYRGDQYEQPLGRGDRTLYVWDGLFDCWKLLL